jgi:subtilisin family serine protease
MSFAIASPQAVTTGRHIVTFSGSSEPGLRSFVATNHGSVDWLSAGAGLASVSGLSSGALAALARLPGVQAVDEDMVFPLETPATMNDNVEVAPGGTESASNPAGAARYSRQWNMRAIQADAAWAAGTLGSASVTVGILDTGIDYLNLDLAGLVDLSRSADMLPTLIVDDTITFVERDTVAKYFPTRQPFTDLFFHGTHVAATASSNAILAAGVTSHTTLLAVKVCAYINTCPTSAVLAGVIYATDHGADVLNLSLGSGFGKPGNGRFLALINTVFNYARSKGVTIVVAAGNSALDLDHLPAAYVTYCATPATVCVSATGPTAQASVDGPWTDTDASADYTNFGRSAISLAAPGGNGSSFVWAVCSRTSLVVPICQTGNFIIGAQGTSMASPHVAGTAALLVERLGRNPGAIKTRLQQTADDLGQPGVDPQYGKGRLNVARAVGAI